MKPSRLVTFAAATSHRAVRASGQASVLTGIWPGSPSRRWGIELTEGQPDTSANKANEKKSRTMKKLIAVAGLGAALTVGTLVGAGTANANSIDHVYRASTARAWHQPCQRRRRDDRRRILTSAPTCGTATQVQQQFTSIHNVSQLGLG